MATKKQTSRTFEANLTRTGYIVTDAALAALARDYLTSAGRADAVRGSYLRVLVAHSQRTMRTVRDALEAVEQTHEHLYGVVMAAVTTPDIAPAEGLLAEERDRRTKERNRRTNFARTAKSVLVRALKAGEQLVRLDPRKVTKEALQAAYATARAGPSTNVERWQKLEERVEALLKTLLEEDPEAARALAADLQSKLVDALPAVRSVTQLARTKRKVGELTLHPH